MEKWKKITQRLLLPPVWVLLLFVVISAAALVAVFMTHSDAAPVAYVVYVFSFYTLTAVCMFCYKVLPGLYRKAKQAVYNNSFGHRYMTDVVFKTHLSLYRSLAINMVYVAVNIVSVFLYHSAWFGILAGYYTILAVMRFLLLRYTNRVGIGKNRVLEFRRSRLCGIILMTVNLTLSGAVLMILYQNKGFEYHGMLIYVMAMYTFYITTHAIISIVKYRKYNSPVMSTSKIIGLSAALVSMLSLETAMLSQFGADSSPEFHRLMIALTGAGVSIAVVTMSVYMILRANREIDRLRAESERS